MAANNGGGRQANSQMSEHVEFSVRAEEDLYLTGSENTIRRVIAETNYSCLMLKTQRFSSLFRHYAKYHGLRKDDLEYYFVDLLENEDTPESVQLQRGDTIMVRKRRKPEPPDVAADDDNFFKDMKELLDDEEHMDAVFIVHDENSTIHNSNNNSSNNNKPLMKSDPYDRTITDSSTNSTTTTMNNDKSTTNVGTTEIRAHKSVLTARAEYFKALFRTTNPCGKLTTSTNNNNNNQNISGGNIKKSSGNITVGNGTMSFREAEESYVNVDLGFTEQHIRYVLEFIYTNRITGIRTISTDDLLCLLHLADRWLLRDMKRLVEHELIRGHMSVGSVARMYGATEQFSAKRLSNACIDFIMSNLRQLAGNTAFEEEMKNYPHLCIPVLKAAADLIPDGPVHKKQRLDHHGISASGTPSASVPGGGSGSGNGGGGGVGGGVVAAGLRSSPVPDSDT